MNDVRQGGDYKQNVQGGGGGAFGGGGGGSDFYGGLTHVQSQVSQESQK